MPMKEEHVALLKKQMELVQQLREVVAAQQRALEQLGDADEDYESAPERALPYADAENEEELEFFEECATRVATQERPSVDVEAEEAGVGHIDWQEPDEEAERGFMSVKPWLGAMAPPSDWSWDLSAERDAVPAKKLVLEHVHGYRTRGVHNNAFWVGEEKVLYFAAGVGIVHDIKANEQSFFRGHDNDIVAMDFNPTKRIAATGQLGRDALLCVWSVDDPSLPVTTIRGHQRGVVAVSISPDGSRVASVGLDSDHTVMVHDISSQRCVASRKGSSTRIVSIAWNLTSAADSNTEFVTVGSKHIFFWTVAGGTLSSRRGLVGRKGEQQTFLCVAFTPEATLIGTEKGELYSFDANKLRTIVNAHNGPMLALASHPATNRIVTGGRDGFVNLWDRKTLKNLVTLDMNNEDPCTGLNSVRSLFMDSTHPDGVLVGTIASSLYHVRPIAFESKTLISGHFGDLSARSSYGELWGLAAHPTLPRFATAGEDGTLRIWDTETRKMISRIEADDKGLCAAYSSDGAFLVVGYDTGCFAVFNTKNMFLISRVRESRKRVQCISFSPDGSMIAVGGASNVVTLYSFDADALNVKARCTGNSSAILSVDFSEDGKYLRTVSQAYELLFYEAETGVHVTASRSLKDVNWATNNAILGWNVQGIWQREADGTDVNCVCVSGDRTLVVSAEDSGNVRLFNYPCVGSGLDRRGKLMRRPGSCPALAHSEHVTRVAFTATGTKVISTGGADNAVMQWRIE